MLYSASTDGIATLPQKIVSFVVLPVQKASAVISNSVSDFFSVFIDAEKNEKENERLKAEIANLCGFVYNRLNYLPSLIFKIFFTVSVG